MLTDLLSSFLKSAGPWLLAFLLWGLTLGVTAWDLERRQAPGRRTRPLPWLLLVALLPFVGFLIYWLARGFSRRPRGPAVANVSPGEAPRRRRETKLKVSQDLDAPLAIELDLPPGFEPAPPTPELPDSQASTVPVELRRARSFAFRFAVLQGPDQGKQFFIDQFPVQIGRDFESGIRLDADTGVSRKHALVYQVNGTLRVRDLNSRHGTQVNGQPVQDHILQPGDWIEVGTTRLQVQRAER